MDNSYIFYTVLEVAEDYLSDEYLKAVETNDVKEMESLNISITTIEMVRETFRRTLLLIGDQDDD